MKKLLTITCISVLFISSCDLLTTRTPEEPKTTGSNFVTASTPEILFQNLKSSVEQKITENYLACFVDSLYLSKRFLYIPAAGTFNQYPILNSWNLQLERQHFDNLKTNLQQNSSISLTYENIESTPLGDSAIYIIDYDLVLNSSNSAISGSYKGTAQFKIFTDSRNQWVIVEWQDIKKENFLCWSDLKGRTY